MLPRDVDELLPREARLLILGAREREARTWERVQWQTAHLLGLVSDKAQTAMLGKMNMARQARERDRAKTDRLWRRR